MLKIVAISAQAASKIQRTLREQGHEAKVYDRSVFIEGSFKSFEHVCGFIKAYQLTHLVRVAGITKS